MGFLNVINSSFFSPAPFGYLGIGDLIIDLDADIEKSSKIESSFISPLDPVNNKKTAAASKNIKEGIETEKGVLKKNLKGSYMFKPTKKIEILHINLT